MTTNLFIFIISIFSAIVLIYMVYTIMLSSGGKIKKKELQISEKDILKQCDILFRQQKYDIIEKLAKRYLENRPEHLELRQILAKTYYHSDKLYDAVKECLTILTTTPTNSEVRLLLARCYKKVNHESKAISELKEVILNDPENTIAIKELGELYLSLNQKISAINMFKKLEELIENNLELSKIKNVLIDLYIELEDYPSAFDELNELLEIYPQDVEASKKLIELYIKVQNYDRALETCEELLVLNENNSLGLWLLNNLINLYYRLRDNEKTIEYANKLLEHPFSDKVKTKTFIAKVLISSGHEDAGMEILKNLSETNTGNIEVKKMLAEAYVEKNDFLSATEIYKTVLDLVNPLDVKAVHTEMSNLFAKWAMYLFNKKDYAECFKIFTVAIQYDSSNAQIYYLISKVNFEIKNYNEAILQIKKAISIEPNNAKFYLLLASCYEDIDNIYEQKNALLASIRYDDLNPVSYFKLAELYESQRDTFNQQKCLERVTELNPKHLEALYKLALIAESQNNLEKAIKYYEEIAKYDINYKNVQENLNMLTKED